MAKKQKRGSGGNRKIGRSTHTPIRKQKAAERPARTEKNRRRRREKHLSLHPKDMQTLAALKSQLR